MPYYIYCVEIRGNALSTVIDYLFKLQKKIITVLTNSHYLAHTHDLFLANNILPFNTLVQYRISLIMFKRNFELVPISLKQMFVSNNYILAHNILDIVTVSIHLEETMNLHIELLHFRVYIY